jgi:hypothetical protein
MNKLPILLAGGLLFAQPAFAQSTPASGTTASGTLSQDTAASSQSNVNVFAIAQGPPSSTDTRVHYSGHEWTTPNVGGSYFAGANQCLVGMGGGAAAGPIGFNINIGKNDEGCTRRSDAAAWHAMGMDNVAVGRMCQDLKNADAFFATFGLACPGTGGSGRYHNPDGSPAAEMRLVSAAGALPVERRSTLDMRDPEVHRMIEEKAREMIRANPQAAASIARDAQLGQEGADIAPTPAPATGGVGSPKRR